MGARIVYGLKGAPGTAIAKLYCAGCPQQGFINGCPYLFYMIKGMEIKALFSIKKRKEKEPVMVSGCKENSNAGVFVCIRLETENVNQRIRFQHDIWHFLLLQSEF